MEFCGISETFSNNNLDETTLEILEKLEITLNPNSIEHCHWLLGRGLKKVTVKRFWRKNANTIRKSKKY